MHIINLEDQITTEWSGGKTTELFISPKDSTYTERDFSYRLSTATVEIETSIFTPLEGVHRTLMVLEGKMELIHQGHHSSTLLPLMSDEFEGGWRTESKGTCTDFNLMCREDTNGQLTGHQIPRNEFLEPILAGIANYIYLYKGTLEINEREIKEGALIVIENETKLSIKAIEESIVVVVNILT